jgi:hypothetical protein
VACLNTFSLASALAAVGGRSSSRQQQAIFTSKGVGHVEFEKQLSGRFCSGLGSGHDRTECAG